MKRILSLLLIAAMLLTGALSMTACTTFRWLLEMMNEKSEDVFAYSYGNGEAFVTGLSESTIKIEQVTKGFIFYPITREDAKFGLFVTAWHFAVIQLGYSLFYLFVHAYYLLNV